jgi:hypothetical protein
VDRRSYRRHGHDAWVLERVMRYAGLQYPSGQELLVACASMEKCVAIFDTAAGVFDRC